MGEGCYDLAMTEPRPGVPHASYAPFVIEQPARGEQRYDIWSRLLIDRIVFLGTAIALFVSTAILALMIVPIRRMMAGVADEGAR